MLVIRLSRKGRRNLPMYRLLVAENSMPTDGKFVEIVGSYNPIGIDQPLEIKKDRVEYWISQGAKPSNTVSKLLNKQGFNLPVEQKNKAPKKVAKPEEAKPIESTPKVEENDTVPVEETVSTAEEVKDNPVETVKDEILTQVQDDKKEEEASAEENSATEEPVSLPEVEAATEESPKEE